MAPFFPHPPPSVVFLTWPGRAELRGFIVLWWYKEKSTEKRTRITPIDFFLLSSLPPSLLPWKGFAGAITPHWVEYGVGWLVIGLPHHAFVCARKKRRNFAGELERKEAVDNSCYRKSLRAMLEVIGWALLYKKGVKKGSITFFFSSKTF